MASFITLLLLLSTASLFAQTETGTIAGAIHDASGAALPRAQVVATNQGKGLTYTGVANESGNYVIGAVPPGAYTLTASAAGFADATRSGVIINVEARVQVDFTMAVGAVQEKVEVTAETPVLESQTSSIGQVIENKTIVTLPLNGRNYSQLAVLVPGATPNPGSRAADGFSLNGNRTFQNSFLIDGIDNNNYILGADTFTNQAIHPSPDAIQEFKVDTASFSAEFGRAAGGVISVSIRSGTNAVHGSAFEFLRNDKLDADDFFSNRAGLKRPPLRRNQFGGTLGGPITRNRSFFFLSYQGTRLRNPRTVTTTVPVAGMAGGDFGSIAIYDPLNVVAGVRQQFSGNLIPASRFDAVGRKLAALYPVPNRPGRGNNFSNNVANADRQDQADARFDHRLSGSDSIFFRFSKLDVETTYGSWFLPPGNGGATNNDYPYQQQPKAYSLAFNETHIFAPTLINEFRAGYSRNSSDQPSTAPVSLYEQFGIKGVPNFPGLTGLPSFSIAGFSQLGDRSFSPNPKLSQVRQFVDSLSWINGNHTLKFGADVHFDTNYAGGANIARGNYSFNGQFTSRVPGQGSGSPIADLLLGQTNSASVSTLLRGDYRDRYMGLFINDTWRLTRGLTLNLGLRYDLQTPFWEHLNHQSNFDLDRSHATYGQLIPATGASMLSRTFQSLETHNFSPRVGFAYQVTPGTVIRAAAGIFYGGWGYQAPAIMGANNVPNFVSVAFPSANTASVSTIVLADGFPAGTVDPVRAANPAGVALLPQAPLPRVYQWNFGVERQMPGNSVLSAAYVGSGASHLIGDINVNQPPPGPGAVNPRRPFPTFGNVILESGFAHSTYHSLQAKLDKRFAKGFSLLSSYTWSHSIDNSINQENNAAGPTQPQNSRDTNIERSSSDIDVRQRFVTSFIYELPLGHGKSWLASSPVLSRLAGGWQLGGIYTASTGVPLSPTVSSNPANTTGTLRPDRLRDGNLSGGTVDRWYDPMAFAVPQPFQFGNSGRHVLVAPGLSNLDALIGRNFRITESKRVELRGEFFNLTNSAHFGKPILAIDLPTAGTITSTASPNRQIQLGLRFVY